MSKLTTFLGGGALFLLHVAMAVLGLMMSLAALAVPVVLAVALVRRLLGAGQ